MEIKGLFSLWKHMFSKPRYIVTAATVAIIFYSINVLISGGKTLANFSSSNNLLESFKFFILLFLGFKNTIKLHTFISLLLISALLGILSALIYFKIDLNAPVKKRTKYLGGAGVVLAAIVPGCAACGIGLISLLGLGSAFLSLLPFDGLEISALSIAILIIAIYKSSADMYVCKNISPNMLKKQDKSAVKE